MDSFANPDLMHSSPLDSRCRHNYSTAAAATELMAAASGDAPLHHRTPSQPRVVRQPSPLFVALLDKVNLMISLIKSVNFRENAILSISSHGIRITVEDAKSYQANIYFQTNLFRKWQLKSGKTLDPFAINTNILLDCLSIVSSSNTATLHFEYPAIGAQSHNNMLRLSLNDEQVFTQCLIKTFYVSSIVDFRFSSMPVCHKVICRSELVRDVFNELDLSSEHVTFVFDPEGFLSLSTDAVTGCATFRFNKSSDLMIAFQCDRMQSIRYRSTILRCAVKAVALANCVQVSFRVNTSGVLCIQYQVKKTDDAEMPFLDFLFAPDEVIGPDEAEVAKMSSDDSDSEFEGNFRVVNEETVESEGSSDEEDFELQKAFAEGKLPQGLVYETVETRKEKKLDVAGLEASLMRIKRVLPFPGLLASCAKCESSNGETIDTIARDDYAREVAFLKQAQLTVAEQLPRLRSAGVRTKRPVDYYAEMLKSDDQMRKIREKLVAKEKELETKEKLKKMREMRKQGKEIQQDVIKRREEEKKTILDAVKKYRKGKGDLTSLSEVLSMGTDKKKKAKQQQNEAAVRNRKREYKNEKYGYGGQKKRSKQNTKESFLKEDFDGGGKKQGKGKKGKAAAAKKGKKQRRAGKNQRQRMKNR